MRALISILFALMSAALPASWAQDFDITGIVEAQKRFNSEPDSEARAALLDQLRAYAGDATIETMNAHLSIMAQDSVSGDLANLHESATLTAAHLQPSSDIVPKQYVDSRFISAVTAFNAHENAWAIEELAHVEGFVRGVRDDSDERPEWARKLGFEALAWRMAIQAYFTSIDTPHMSEADVELILAGYGADADALNATAQASEDESGLPLCPGRMRQTPPLKYPYRKAKAGKVGAVILGLEFDAEGEVINPVVLASVPISEFDQKSLRVVDKWRFKPTRARDVGVTCRLQRTNVVQPVVFFLD